MTAVDAGCLRPFSLSRFSILKDGIFLSRGGGQYMHDHYGISSPEMIFTVKKRTNHDYDEARKGASRAKTAVHIDCG